MTKSYKKGDYLVLRHKTAENLIVVGLLEEDFSDQLGASSLFNLHMVVGLPVDAATFNSNMWNIVGETGVNKTSAMEHALVRCLYDVIRKLNKDF